MFVLDQRAIFSSLQQIPEKRGLEFVLDILQRSNTTEITLNNLISSVFLCLHGFLILINYSFLFRRDIHEIFAQPVDPKEVRGWFLVSTYSVQNVLFLNF